MRKRSILALDLATRTGWAHYREGDEGPSYSTLLLPRTGDDIGRFVIALRRWMVPFCEISQVTDVVYEAPMVKKTDDRNIVWKLFSLAGEAAANAYALEDCRSELMGHGEMAVFWYGAEKFTGSDEISSRDIGKGYSMLAAKLKGWPCEFDDESDALGLLCAYAHKHRIPVNWDNRPCPSPQFLSMAEKGRVVRS